VAGPIDGGSMKHWGLVEVHAHFGTTTTQFGWAMPMSPYEITQPAQRRHWNAEPGAACGCSALIKQYPNTPDQPQPQSARGNTSSDRDDAGNLEGGCIRSPWRGWTDAIGAPLS